RNLGRRRDQRALPRADGARRSEEQGEEGIRRRARSDGPHAGSVPHVGGSASRNQKAALSSPAYQGRGRRRRELCLSHFQSHEAGSGCLTMTPPSPDPRPLTHDPESAQRFMIGMDVGSTTVKPVVIDPVTDQVLWSDYEGHGTKQAEKVLEFCRRFETEIPGFSAERSRMFITGSGGNGLTKYLGAKFVQEVNAVSLAVERLYPECG